jgi:DNA mismatch repair protein MutS2
MSFENESLEYQSLRHILIKFSDSPLGAQLVEQLAPISHRIEIQKQFELVEECLQLLKQGLQLRFLGLVDPSPLCEKLRVEGAALSPKEILQILELLVCSESVKKSLGANARDLPNLLEIGRALPDLRVLTSELTGKINESGDVEDHASPVLKRIRNEIGVVRNRVCRSLEQMLRRESESRILQDDLITIRNERFVIPVKAESRKELAGVVHGTSSSGSTVFLEPLEVLEQNNQLIRLKEQADDEIQNILLSLTDSIRKSLPELESVVRLLSRLDFNFAKARFGQKYRCVIPEVNEGNVLSIVDGRHPVLEDALRARSLEIVPISVDLDRSRHVLVISGPNTGGKTVALKTIGLLTLMALSGLPVPADAANVCVFHQVFADIGDHQSISENLSTFSSHLLNIKAILERVSAPALVLLDELGTGTDPAEGSALGVAVVDDLRQKGVMAVVTTHHNGLKMYASRTPGVLNASVEFDEATLRPTFRLIHGIPGNSSGLEIARRLGLEEALVSRAQQLVSREEQAIAEYSKDLRGEITRVSKLREQIEAERNNLETRRTRLEEDHAEFEKKRRKEIEQSWQRAWDMFQKETKKLISEIQDKYLAVRVRREMERRSAQVRAEVQQQLFSSPENVEALSSNSPTRAVDLALTVGSKVFVKGLGQEGTLVTALKDQRWEVAVGSLKCVVSSSELEPIEKFAESRAKRFQLHLPARVTVQMNSPEPQTNEINLVGCTVDEAISRADKFLDMACMASMTQVRLIHGSGMGILRKAIAEWLSDQPHVEKFQPAAVNEGGNGVTVVSLKV